MSDDPNLSRCCPYLGSCTGINPVVYRVGFVQDISFVIFLIFIFLGIISNLIILIHTIFFKMKVQSQLGKYMAIISVVEIFISVCWILNIFIFKDTKIIATHCTICTNYAIVPTFLHLFSWVLIFETNRQLKKLIASQLVTNDRKEIIKTVGICAAFALAMSLFFSVTKLTGISVSPYLYI